MSQVLGVLWDVVKVLIIPACLFFLERQITQRDDKREREYNARKKELDEQEKKNLELQFLMMQRMDKLSDMVHLMAQKLHEKQIINGDLQSLDAKYRELDEDYEREVTRLALLYSKR